MRAAEREPGLCIVIEPDVRPGRGRYVACTAAVLSVMLKLTPVEVLVTGGAGGRGTFVSADTREGSAKGIQNLDVAFVAPRLAVSSFERVARPLEVVEWMYPERVSVTVVTGRAVVELDPGRELAGVRALVAFPAPSRRAHELPDAPSRVHAVASVARDGLVASGERKDLCVGRMPELRWDKAKSIVTIEAFLRLREELPVVNVAVAAAAGVLVPQIAGGGRILIAPVERQFPRVTLVAGHFGVRRIQAEAGELVNLGRNGQRCARPERFDLEMTVVAASHEDAVRRCVALLAAGAPRLMERERRGPAGTPARRNHVTLHTVEALVSSLEREVVGVVEVRGRAEHLLPVAGRALTGQAIGVDVLVAGRAALVEPQE